MSGQAGSAADRVHQQGGVGVIQASKRFSRRVLLGAAGCVLLAFGFGRKNVAAGESDSSAKPAPPPPQELCVECLAKRAKQRTAFINKWV